jgi:hypothetical protein
LRSSARFWLGLAGETDSAGAEPWGDDPTISIGSPWARYAIFENRFEPLANAYADVISTGAVSAVGR